MENPKVHSKAALFLFIFIAFGIPFLLTPLYLRGGIFSASSYSLWPAAGVMIVFLTQRERKNQLPVHFFLWYLGCTAIAAIVWLFAPALSVISTVYTAGTLIGWCILAAAGKEKRKRAGLSFSSPLAFCGYAALFILLYFSRSLLFYCLTGKLRYFLSDLVSLYSSGSPIFFFSRIASFAFLAIGFLGEEYGWRFYLTPALQARTGRRIGILTGGLLWAMWHFPADLIHSGNPSDFPVLLAVRIVRCVTLSAFYSYTYEKTGNIWLPAFLHFLNNSLLLTEVFCGRISLDHQEDPWTLFSFLLSYALLFGVFFLIPSARRPDPADQLHKL